MIYHIGEYYRYNGGRGNKVKALYKKYIEENKDVLKTELNKNKK